MDRNEDYELTHTERLFITLPDDVLREINKAQKEDYDLSVEWIGNEVNWHHWPEYSERQGYTEMGKTQIRITLKKTKDAPTLG